MAIRVKSQRDYLLTEVSIELPCQLNDLDYLMKTMKGTGKIVAVYSQGNLSGINLEQRTKIGDNASDEVRRLIGVATQEINGH